MFFFLSIPLPVLPFWAVLTLLKHSTSLSACLFTFAPPPPPPPNNLINARAPSLDPRLSLFFEVRYCQSGFWVQASVCLGPVSRKSREAVSVYETKWSRLLARTRALILYISIWIFVFGPEKLPGLLRNEPLASKLYMLKKDLTRFIHLFPSTQNSRRWKKCSASWVGKER